MEKVMQNKLKQTVKGHSDTNDGRFELNNKIIYKNCRIIKKNVI